MKQTTQSGDVVIGTLNKGVNKIRTQTTSVVEIKEATKKENGEVKKKRNWKNIFLFIALILSLILISILIIFKKPLCNFLPQNYIDQEVINFDLAPIPIEIPIPIKTICEPYLTSSI